MADARLEVQTTLVEGTVKIVVPLEAGFEYHLTLPFSYDAQRAAEKIVAALNAPSPVTGAGP